MSQRQAVKMASGGLSLRCRLSSIISSKAAPVPSSALRHLSNEKSARCVCVCGKACNEKCVKKG